MIVEYGCANIPTDSNRMIYQWPQLAEAVVKAVADYSNVRYTPPTYTIHVVRPGESIFTIAQKYNVPVSRIIQDNDLATSEVFAGQQLVINF
jgi:LysM repeat protein